MPFCSAENCSSRLKRGSGKSFHRFPRSNPTLLKKWLVNMRKESWSPTQYSSVCSDHFEEICFDRTGQTNRLHVDAVPTLFNFTKDIRKGLGNKMPSSNPGWESHDITACSDGAAMLRGSRASSGATARSQLTKGLQCFAINCFTYRNSVTRDKGITFHKFPSKEKNNELYEEWVKNCRRKVEPTHHARLCSQHFDAACFIRTLQRTQLQEDAIPTLFDLPDRIKKSGRKRVIEEELEQVTKDEVLPLKRRIKPKLRDDEIIEWGPKHKTSQYAQKLKRSTGGEQEISSRKNKPLRRKITKESPNKSRSNTSRSSGSVRSEHSVSFNSGGVTIKEEPVFKSEILSDEESNDFWSPEEENGYKKLVLTPLKKRRGGRWRRGSVRENLDHSFARQRRHSESSDDENRPRRGRGANCFAHICDSLRNKTSREDGVTFHKFPLKDKSPERFAAWIENCKRDREPTQHSLLCSRHFEDSCFDRTGQTVRLRPGSVPTIFPFSQDQSNSTIQRQSIALKKTDKLEVLSEEERGSLEELSSNQDGAQCDEKPQQKSKNGNVAQKLPPTRDKIVQLPNNRMYFEFAQPKTKVILHVKPPTETEVKVENLEVLLESLRLKHMLSRSAEELLEAFRNLPQGLIRKGSEENEEILPTKHTKDVINFATVLYVHSSKAFDLLSTKFLFPEKRLLHEHLQSKEYWPGFTQEAKELLKNSSAQHLSEFCSIMIDFIALKKQRDFDHSFGRWTGHVDFCGGLDPSDSDELPLASEMFMFSAVGLINEWKMPFGYFPVHEISAESIHNLVKEAIVILEECDLKVMVLVCDGIPQTIKMGILFGCNIKTQTFRELVTSFPHPFDEQRRIHLVFGIYHSLVLLRNLLAEKGILRSSTYGIIRWQFFEDLLSNNKRIRLESDEDLKDDVIELQSLRRIIKICHPSFNGMINRAFELANDLGLKEYEDSDPTVNLMADVYRAFDMLNSRNPVTTGEKPPITNPFVAEQLEAMTVIGQRIFGLETFSGIPIVEGGRWMSAVLFAFTLKSVSIIASELISKTTLKYFTTYRVNLDHSDLILRCIQKYGEWTDIPTVSQFREGYRLLFESYVKSSAIPTYWNDFDGDDLTVAQGVICPFRRLLSVPTIEMDLLPSSEYLTDYNTDITVRAKYVIKNLSYKLSCTECMAVLLNNAYFGNLAYKIDFDHIRPSKFTIKVLKITEILLKVKLLGSKTVSKERLVVDSFYECLDLFGANYHTSYDHVLEEPHHVLCLVKSVIRTYLNHRLKSTMFLPSLKIRLFKGTS